MKYFIGAVSLLIIMILGFLIFIYTGLYNMSGTSHHTRMTLWAINTLRDNSIKHHAKDPNIKPPDLTDTSLIRTGFIQFNRMCVGCHGAPGVEQRQLVLKGYYPRPPKLLKAANEWSPEELFWITKNGLKMTSMPAFGTILADDKIWALIAFMDKLPNISKEEYQLLVDHTKGEIVK